MKLCTQLRKLLKYRADRHRIAISYARKKKENLMKLLLDGRLELSDNSAERRVNSYVIGQKKFRFLNTENGAKGSAVVYSLVESEKVKNVFENLQTVLL